MSRRRINVNELYPYRKDADGKRLCRVCGGAIPKGRRTSCSKACGDELSRAAYWDVMRRAVWKRDGGVCQRCGWDMATLQRALWRFIRPTWMESRETVKPRVLHVIEFLRQITGHNRSLWYNGIKWECDHRVPLHEGGAHAMENLRVLCRPCHVAETAALRKRMSESRRDAVYGGRLFGGTHDTG